MKKTLIALSFVISPFVSADHAETPTTINGLEFGPLAQLAGVWKSTPTGGVDVAPGQESSNVGKGGPAVEPFYEVMTFEPAADATNASDQYLVAMYYKQEVFRKRDDTKFHDQRGYLIYDAANNMVYNSYCIPRAVCVVSESVAGDKMQFALSKKGVAESNYMNEKAKTTDFIMMLDVKGDTMRYSQTTELDIYGKLFSHTDASELKKVK